MKKHGMPSRKAYKDNRFNSVLCLFQKKFLILLRLIIFNEDLPYNFSFFLNCTLLLTVLQLLLAIVYGYLRLITDYILEGI